MTSDDARKAHEPKFRSVGTGLSQTFRCAVCSKFRLVAGRRLQRVHGLKTWVCKDCA